MDTGLLEHLTKWLVALVVHRCSEPWWVHWQRHPHIALHISRKVAALGAMYRILRLTEGAAVGYAMAAPTDKRLLQRLLTLCTAHKVDGSAPSGSFHEWSRDGGKQAAGRDSFPELSVDRDGGKRAAGKDSFPELSAESINSTRDHFC